MPRRLTFDQVQEIRASGHMSYPELAAKYGVHTNTIGEIFRGNTWTKPRSTLTKEQIVEIRSLHAVGMRTIDIVRATGVKYSVVSRMKYRETYQALETT
jgi:uncharacterized protein YjcR